METRAELAARPLIELVPAAGLRWAVVLEPIPLLSAMRRTAPELLPEARVRAFASSTGVALDEARQVVVAGFDTSTLYLVRARDSAARIQQRLRRRILDAPQLDRRDGWPRELAGPVGQTRIRFLAWDRHTSACAVGSGVPARAAWLFAENRLRESPNALQGSSLRRLSASPPAPLHVYVPGPLPRAGELAAPLGQLQAAQLQLAFVADQLRLWAQLVGDWPAGGAEHWCTWFEHIAGSGTGALLGLDRPIEACSATRAGARVELTASWDAAALLRTLDAVLNLKLEALMAEGELESDARRSAQAAANPD